MMRVVYFMVRLGLVVEIDGIGQVGEVTERILNALTARGLSPAL